MQSHLKVRNYDKVKVRFLDLGITKTLDRSTELREIDEKFFNCPNKALYCTINLRAEEVPIQLGQKTQVQKATLPPLKLRHASFSHVSSTKSVCSPK